MANFFILLVFIVAIAAYYAVKNFRKQNRIKKKRRALDEAFERMIKQHNLYVKHLDRFNHKLIGLDSKNKKLLFIDHSKKEKQEVCLSIRNVDSCNIVELEDGQQERTAKILLRVKGKEGETVISFFDDAQDLITDMPALMRRARFWKQRIELHKYLGTVTPELEYVL